MDSRGLLIVAVVAIAILLVGSTAFSHSAEAKKRKPSEIKVYVSNVGEIEQKLLLRVCISDDDDCFTKEKTTDLQKHSGDKRATVATYQLTFSGNPEDEFSPSDVLACGKLNGHPTNSDDSVCVSLQKVKSKHWKAVMSYNDLLNTQ
jgi:hypothetical protein